MLPSDYVYMNVASRINTKLKLFTTQAINCDPILIMEIDIKFEHLSTFSRQICDMIEFEIERNLE
jgi:hypothetical protein